MRRLRSFLLALSLAVSLVGAGGGAAWAIEPGQKAADFDLPALQGGRVSLRQHQGKVVLIDFWASWCEPCKRELPELEKLGRELGPRGLVILAVNIDEQRANAERMARQLGLTLPVALDPDGKVAGTWDPPKMPTSYLVDRKGVVRFVHAGFDGPPDVARLRRELEQLLAAK